MKGCEYAPWDPCFLIRREPIPFFNFRLANWVSGGADPAANTTTNSSVVDVGYYLSIYGSVAVANTVFSLVSMLPNFFYLVVAARLDRVFALRKLFEDSLIFSGKAVSLPERGTPEKLFTWVGSGLTR
jgi:hypothetical protein